MEKERLAILSARIKNQVDTIEKIFAKVEERKTPRSSMENEILEQVRNIVFEQLKGLPARVYLYGSWARGEARRTSDIDVAVWCECELPREVIMNIRFALEESTVPYRVDIVDLAKVDESMRQKVLEEGIVWKDCCRD